MVIMFHGIKKVHSAVIYKNSREIFDVLKWIQEIGRIKDAEMRWTFNMRLGRHRTVGTDRVNQFALMPRILFLCLQLSDHRCNETIL